ncbi:hypothetical protein FACS1894202_03310 [Clostridia bacterium]|nr:hypothetical protein FACS1894202_03310 [Clostridia bacterium]
MAAYTINLADLSKAERDFTVARKIDGLSSISEENQKLVRKQLADMCFSLPPTLRYAQCIVKTADMRIKPALMIMIGFFSLGKTSGVNVRMYFKNNKWTSDLFVHGNEQTLSNVGSDTLVKELGDLAGKGATTWSP